MSEDEKRIVSEKDQKAYKEFRNTLEALVNNLTEKELYERVTKPKPINMSDMVRISAKREGDRVDITLSFTKEYLRKMLGEK
jgi:hypothetical protein